MSTAIGSSCMRLPFAARQSFLENGYAILPAVLSAPLIDRLRVALVSATVARSRCFLDVPDLDTLLKSTNKLSDPLYERLTTRLQRRQYLLRLYRSEKKRRRELARVAARVLQGRRREDLSGEELWRLSEAVSAEVAKMSGRGCQSTVHNDPQMLRAINEYRSNVWMTNTALRDIVGDRELWSPLGAIAADVGGVEHPVLFGDAPVMREGLGSALGFQCTAPSIGVRTNRGKNACAVSLLIYTHTPDRCAMPLYVLRHSHRFVREQYINQVAADDLALPFLPMQSHLPEQLKRFQFDESVVGAPADSDGVIGPGTVVVIDPHLMFGMGLNATHERIAVYKLNLVSRDAAPYMRAPSWIRAWRSLPREVNFASPVVFPPFYDTAQPPAA